MILPARDMAHKLIWRLVLNILAVIVLGIALVYLVKRSVLERSPDIDFRFIWTAGKLWAQGIDPYSARYTEVGHALFPTGNYIAYWLYPPQWWVIARPLAAFPVGRVLMMWRGLSAVLLVASASALAWAVRRARPDTPGGLLVLLVAMIALMEGTAQTLLLGQTSMLVFAGFCLMGMAVVTGARPAMVAAVVLLTLKPQFAVPIIICLLVTRTWRLSVVIALALTGLASLPQVLQFGLLPSVKGLVGNMAAHGQLASNQPENLIGFSYLVWQLTGATLSNAWDIALDLAATMAFGLSIGRQGGLNDRDKAALAIGLIGSAMFFLPVHDYDTVALGPVAILGILLSGTPRTLALAAVALALRPGIISAQFGNRDIGDSFALSLSGLVAVIAALIVAITRPAWRKSGAEQAAGKHTDE